MNTIVRCGLRQLPVPYRLSCHYPVKLIKHLRVERKLSVEKILPGVYYINKETFNAQIIVTNRLPPEDNLYLRCLTGKLHDMELADRLTDVVASEMKPYESEEGFRITPAKTVDEVHPSDYTCIILPDTINPLPALFDDKLIDFLRKGKDSDTLYAAISSSPILLRMGYDIGDNFMKVADREYTEAELTFYWTDDEYSEFLEELKELTE